MTMVESALDCLNRGWSIFPLDPHPGIDPKDKKPWRKKPLFKALPLDENDKSTWKPFQIQPPTREQVIEWWTKYPNAGIAIVCGKVSGIVVVDVDEYHGGTTAKLTPTVMVKSGSGQGYHFYYAYYPGLPNNNDGVVGQGIDVKTDGGYVCGVGTLHDSGGRYEYEMSPDDASLVSLDQWVIDKLLHKKRFEDILSGVPEGTRYTSAAQFVGYLLTKFPQEQWESEVWPLMQLWNQQNENANEPENLKNLRKTFENICRREQGKTGSTIAPEQVDISAQQDSLQQQLADIPPGKILPTGFKTLDTVIDGLRYGAFYLTAGLKKSGKSLLQMQIIVNALQNGNKIGVIDTELGPVEYFDRIAALEFDKPIREVEVDSKYRKLFSEKYKDQFYYVFRDAVAADGSIELPKVMSQFNAWIEAGVEILGFDNLTTLANDAKEGSREAAWTRRSRFIQQFIGLAKQKSIIFLSVLHTQESMQFTIQPEKVKKAIEEGNVEKIFDESFSYNLRPTSKDIYGGGQIISQISGGILLVWRPFQFHIIPNLQEATRLILSDMRYGGSGTEIPLIFDAEKLRFNEKTH